MYKVEVTPQDVVASRFAISPLIETMHAFFVLSGQYPAGANREWAERWRAPYLELRQRHPVLRSVDAIAGNKGDGNVDFIAPPPTGVNVPFATELARMRATPVAQAHAEIARALADRPHQAGRVRDVLFRDDIVTLLADAFAAVWTEIVSVDWPRIRAILERDVAQRAGQLAAYGWAAALDDLSSQVRWHGDGYIEVRLRSKPDGSQRLGGRGLLFLPSAFTNAVGMYLDDAWPYALVYPARGIAVRPPAPAAGLAGLVGRSRARILTELATPATTTQLAGLFGQSLGTTGEHLAALRRAGLVSATRTGRKVFYTRTALGDALVQGKV